MRRYLQQIACVLRPGSVTGADLALRSFAAFLTETAPEVSSIADVVRRHVEDYKPWLAARPGQNGPRVTPATMAHRLGTLRMFFVRIDEWSWPEAPVRVPMFNGDLPRLDHPLPKALDDAAAAKLLRAARADGKPLVGITVEVLLRTGLRVGEYTALPADAVVQIGAAPWLHVPPGKLRDDRYLPLHPNLLALIDDYRAKHVPAGHPLLLPRPNGTPLDRHAVTRLINRAGNRRVLRRHRQSRIPLRQAADVACRCDRTQDGPAAPRTPPPARQRLLHTARRARLRLRSDLRELHLLPNQHPIPPHPPSPTRRRRQEGTTTPSRPVQPAPHQPQRQPSIMINLISITHIMPMTEIPAHPGRDRPAYSSSRAVYYDLR
jgi:site-specific recombinase XerD